MSDCRIGWRLGPESVSRNTITLLYDETAARVDLEAIDRLCGYFGVTIGELFEQVAPLPDLSAALGAPVTRGTKAAASKER